jgi:hypothetical protein
MRQDEPTRPIHVPQLRSVTPRADLDDDDEDERARRAALAVERETERLPLVDLDDD